MSAPAVDFGSCWSCVDDLVMPATIASGNRVVGEAIARRLITRRGGLVSDPNYGFDLGEFVEADLSPRDLALVSSGIVAECKKDDRVVSAVATVTLAIGVLTAQIALTTGGGPFTLVLAVSAVSAPLLQVTPS